MTSDPARERSLFQVASREFKNRQYAFDVGCRQFVAVQQEEQLQRHESRALVPVDKRMVTSDAKTVGSGKVGDIGLAIVRQLLRASECRGQEIRVAHTRGAAVLRKLFIVRGPNDGRIKPDPPLVGRTHLANSRNTLRRFFITRRAAAIWVSKSALYGVSV